MKNTQEYNQIMKAKDNQKVKINHLNKSARLLGNLVSNGLLETAVHYSSEVNLFVKEVY